MSLKSPAMITNRVKIPSSWFVLCIVLITQHTISYQHLNFKYLTVKLQTEHKHDLICIYNYKPNINKIWFVFSDAIYARYNLFCIVSMPSCCGSRGRQTNWSEHDSRLARTPGYTWCYSNRPSTLVQLVSCIRVLAGINDLLFILLSWQSSSIPTLVFHSLIHDN